MYNLYFYYDRERKPLYIGKTENVKRRHYEHKRQKSWYEDAKYIGVRQYASQTDMDAMENYYIGTMNPKYNKACKNKSHIFPNVEIEDKSAEQIVSVSSFEEKYPSRTKSVKERIHKPLPTLKHARPNERDIINFFLGEPLRIGENVFALEKRTADAETTERFILDWSMASLLSDEETVFIRTEATRENHVEPAFCRGKKKVAFDYKIGFRSFDPGHVVYRLPNFIEFLDILAGNKAA